MLAIPWVLASLAVAYVGRDRSGGFWGTLLFSLVFTPIGGALALLLMRGPQARPEVAVHRMAPAGTRAGSRALLSVGHWMVTGLALPWLLLVAAFAAAFWTMGDQTSADLWLAVTQSLSAGTLNDDDGSQLSAGVRWVARIERLSVVLLIAGAIVRLLVSRHGLLTHELRAAAQASSDAVSALEARVHAQQMELERLRGESAAAAPSGAGGVG